MGLRRLRKRFCYYCIAEGDGFKSKKHQGMIPLYEPRVHRKTPKLAHVPVMLMIDRGVRAQEELMTGDESEPLIITVTSDWEVKQTSSLVTGAMRCDAMRCCVCYARLMMASCTPPHHSGGDYQTRSPIYFAPSVRYCIHPSSCVFALVAADRVFGACMKYIAACRM